MTTSMKNAILEKKIHLKDYLPRKKTNVSLQSLNVIQIHFIGLKRKILFKTILSMYMITDPCERSKNY